jgi:uncharacterized membrane protein
MTAPPRWAPAVSLALALTGLAVAAYLTIAHYTASSILACSSSGLVNCELVTTSAESRFLGVPVALLGLLWFVAMTVLCLPAAWRSTDRRVHQLRVLASVVAIVFVLWLIYAELIIIGAICLWCTAVHLITFGLFAISVWAYSYS